MSFWTDTFPNIDPPPLRHRLDCCSGQLWARIVATDVTGYACSLYLPDEIEPDDLINGQRFSTLTETVEVEWRGNVTDDLYVSNDEVTTWQFLVTVQSGDLEPSCGDAEVTLPDEFTPPPPIAPDTSVVRIVIDTILEKSGLVTLSDVKSAATGTTSETEWVKVADLNRSSFDPTEAWYLLSCDASESQFWAESPSASYTKVNRVIQFAARGKVKIAGKFTAEVRTTILGESEGVTSFVEVSIDTDSAWACEINLGGVSANHVATLVSLIFEPTRG